MTKPTSCHYKSVPISHHFLCLVGTMRSESVRFTRGGHSYALCSSTCDHIQHVFMWLRYTVAFLAGSKVKGLLGHSTYGQDNQCERSLVLSVSVKTQTKSRMVKPNIVEQSILDSQNF